jgi:predicted polyphosphate/ATP-dependent NAD kinase
MVADGGKVETETVETEVEEIEPGVPKDILKSWLKGDIELEDTKVRELVKDAYNQVLVERDEIVDYLVNTANLVAAEQVKLT